MKSMCLILLGALHKGKQELTRNNVKSGSLTHMKTLFAISAMFKYQKDLFLLSLSFKCSILNVSKLLKIRTGFNKLSVKAFFISQVFLNEWVYCSPCVCPVANLSTSSVQCSHPLSLIVFPNCPLVLCLLLQDSVTSQTRRFSREHHFVLPAEA